MRLKHYITESNEYQNPDMARVENIIKTECKPFLTLLRTEPILFRGVPTDQFLRTHLVKKKGYIKSERRPKDIPKFLHEYMNKQFIKYRLPLTPYFLSVTPDILPVAGLLFFSGHDLWILHHK